MADENEDADYQRLLTDLNALVPPPKPQWARDKEKRKQRAAAALLGVTHPAKPPALPAHSSSDDDESADYGDEEDDELGPLQRRTVPGPTGKRNASVTSLGTSQDGTSRSVDYVGGDEEYTTDELDDVDYPGSDEERGRPGMSGFDDDQYSDQEPDDFDVNMDYFLDMMQTQEAAVKAMPAAQPLADALGATVSPGTHVKARARGKAQPRASTDPGQQPAQQADCADTSSEDEGLLQQQGQDTATGSQEVQAGMLPGAHSTATEHEDIELPEGQPLPKGRLGALYKALAANRALQAHLRTVVAPRLDKLIDDNWFHAEAVRQVPETQMALTTGDRRSILKGATKDPLRKATGPSGQRRMATTSRIWALQGQAPEPNQDTVTLSQQMEAMPWSYERTKWPAHLLPPLRKGVTAEIRAYLTEQAVKEAQEAMQATQAVAGTSAGEGQPGLADLTQRFQEIQAVEPDSAEGFRVAGLLTDEHWARVSVAHVKERSAVDCKVYWLHSLRTQQPWQSEESQRLHELVAQLGTENWPEVARQLGTGRTAAQCLTAFVKANRPAGHATRKRRVWMPEDVARLEAYVAKFGTNWVKISEEWGGKFDRHQLRDRWHGQTALRGVRKMGKWDADEDERLMKAVSECGPKWKQVCNAVATRTAQQCRERYENVLNPDLKFRDWEERELELLKSAVDRVMKETGGRMHWSKIAEHVPDRTDDMCRRAWRQLSTKGVVKVVVPKAALKFRKAAEDQPAVSPGGTGPSTGSEGPAKGRKRAGGQRSAGQKGKHTGGKRKRGAGASTEEEEEDDGSDEADGDGATSSPSNPSSSSDSEEEDKGNRRRSARVRRPPPGVSPSKPAAKRKRTSARACKPAAVLPKAEEQAGEPQADVSPGDGGQPAAEGTTDEGAADETVALEQPAEGGNVAPKQPVA